MATKHLSLNKHFGRQRFQVSPSCSRNALAATNMQTIKYIIIILFVFTKVYSQTDTNTIKDFEKFITDNNNKLIGTTYPNFYLKNDKGIVTNEKLIGKVIFINFWTTFCRPCIAEMNSLNTLYETYKDDNKFKFISITSDDEQMIKNAIREFNIKYNIYKVTSKESYDLNLNNGFPTSIIIDTQGKIHYIKSGGSSDPIKANEIILKEIEPVIYKILKN